MRFFERFFYFSILITAIFIFLNLTNYREYQLVAVKNIETSTVYAADDGGNANWHVSTNNAAFQLPFSLILKSVNTDFYKSGKPKNQSVILEISYKNDIYILKSDVNKPAFFEQYGFYLEQISNNYAKIKITNSRFRFLTYFGLIFVIVASICLLFKKRLNIKFEKSRAIFAIVLIILVAFVILITTPLMQKVEIPPILRSIWFLPHVIAFILSYSILIFAWIESILSIRKDYLLQNSKIDFEIGTILYCIGLTLGIFWAHSAWGKFWSWDIKETLSLIVFLYNVLIMLILNRKSIGSKMNIALQTIGILLVVFCWIGPDIFHFGGLHSY